MRNYPFFVFTISHQKMTSEKPHSTALISTALISLFALLTVIGAKIRVDVFEIPFTLQTVAVYSSGLFLGWRSGFISQSLYLCLGLFFPVFAGEGFGMDYIFTRISSGYLLSFPFVAALIGRLSRHTESIIGRFIAVEIGSLLLFCSGVIWLHYAAEHPSWWHSIQNGWLKFLPVDLLKIAIVIMLYTFFPGKKLSVGND